MKFFLFFISVVICGKASSQNLNVAGHDVMNDPKNMVSINSKCYYLERQGRDCCGDGARIIGVNATAQTIFTVNFNYSPNGFSCYPVKLIRTNDHGLLALVSGSMSICMDYGSYTIFNSIVKADTSGVVQFTASINTATNTYYSAPMEVIHDIAQHSNGWFYAASDSTVYRCSPATGASTMAFTSVKNIKSISCLSNGNLLLSSAYNGSMSLVETTTTGVVVSQQTVSSLITKVIESSSGKLYALTGTGSIEQYTSGYTFISSLSVPSVTLTDFDVRNDSVFTAGTSSANMPYYCMANTGLSILYQTTGSYSNTVPTGIAVTNKNKVGIVARSSSTNTLVTFSNIYQFPLGGNIASRADVGVESVAISSATFDPAYYPYGMYGPVSYPVVSFEADVTIANYGSDTVHSFCLNHTSNYQPGSAIQVVCETFFEHYIITIPPGGTTAVHVGPMYGDRMAMSYTTPANSPVNVEECFFTTAPSESGDAQINNDAACAQFTVSYITGIETYNLQDTELSFFPNPFNASLTVTGYLKIEKLQIYTMLGALQYEQPVNAKAVTVNDPGLPPGIYMLKLYTEKGITSKKIVKE